MEEEYEYDKLPVKFTDGYLKDNESSSYVGVDYDDEIDSDKDSDKDYINNQYSNSKKFGNIKFKKEIPNKLVKLKNDDPYFNFINRSNFD